MKNLAVIGCKPILPLLCFLLIVSYSCPTLISGLERNNTSLITLHILQVGDPAMLKIAENNLISILNDDCRGAWFLGLVYNALGELKRRDKTFEEALRCSNVHVQLIRVISSYNKHLSELAVKEHPEQADGWFWLASNIADEDPEQAIDYYQIGLFLSPYRAKDWVALGNLLKNGNPVLAIQAYLKACHLGDPGNHGCYGAGLVAEEQGDIPLAIRYYRMSDWEGSLQRAAQLEQTQPKQKVP